MISSSKFGRDAKRDPCKHNRHFSSCSWKSAACCTSRTRSAALQSARFGLSSSHHLRNGCRGLPEQARGHANKVGARGRVGLQVLLVVGWFDCRVHPSKRFVSLHVENIFAQWEPRPSLITRKLGGGGLALSETHLPALLTNPGSTSLRIR